MEFDELFKSYADYGFTKPIGSVSGIETLQIKPPIPAPSMTGDNNFSPELPEYNPNEPLTFEGIMQALGFALNPVMGVTNLAVQQATGKTIPQNILSAVNTMRGRDTTPAPSGIASVSTPYDGGSGGVQSGMSSQSQREAGPGFSGYGTSAERGAAMHG